MARYVPTFRFPDLLPLILRAAEAGLPQAQWKMAMRYLVGNGIDRDLTKAEEWLRTAAGTGYHLASRHLGQLLRSGISERMDHAEALTCFLAAAAQGDADAQREAGLMLATGQGTAPDAAAARRWLELAFVNGDLAAGVHVGHLELFGAPNTGSPSENNNLVVRLAHSGNPTAAWCHAVHLLGTAGRQSQEDTKVAAAILEPAARAGDRRCQRELGRLLAFGPESTRDEKNGLSWLLLAAKGGDAWAAALCGVAFSNGIGAPEQPELADQHLRAAHRGGFPGATWYMAQHRLRHRPLDSVLWHQVLELYRKALERGFGLARRELWDTFAPHKNYIPVEPAFLTLAENAFLEGSPGGMIYLGRLYAQGFGEDPETAGGDPTKSLFWLATVAEENYPAGMVALARTLLYPHAYRDVPTGLALLDCAAALGHRDAAGILGSEMEPRNGSIYDPEYSATATLFSAERGDPIAMHNLAICYRDGQGLPQCDDRATYWFDKSRTTSVETSFEPQIIDLGGTLLDDFAGDRKEARVLPFARKKAAP